MEQSEATPRRGRPRNEAIDEAALDAALDLLVEGGRRAVTIDAVARLAGTSPPALYRRWPHPEDLLWAAMRRAVLRAANRTHAEGPYSIDGLGFEAALAQTMRRCAEIFSDRRVAASYLAICTGREAEMREEGYDRLRLALNDPLLQIVQPAAEAAGVAPARILDLIVGTTIYKAVIQSAPPNEDAIREMAALVAAGCRALAAAREG